MTVSGLLNDRPEMRNKLPIPRFFKLLKSRVVFFFKSLSLWLVRPRFLFSRLGSIKLFLSTEGFIRRFFYNKVDVIKREVLWRKKEVYHPVTVYVTHCFEGSDAAGVFIRLIKHRTI